MHTHPDGLTKSLLPVQSLLTVAYDDKNADFLKSQPGPPCIQGTTSMGSVCVSGNHLSMVHPILQDHFLYLEFDVVTDELVALHELPLVAPVLCDHREGVVDGGA